MLWFPVVFMAFINDYDRHMYVFQMPFENVETCTEFSRNNQQALFYLAYHSYLFKRKPLNLMCVSEEGLNELKPRRFGIDIET